MVKQVQDSEKVTSLEEEKERTAESTEKLVRALKEKWTALDKKEKHWVARGKKMAELETEVAQLRSREINQEAFAKLVIEKVCGQLISKN